MKNYLVAFIVFIAVVSCTSGDDDMTKAVTEQEQEENTEVAKGSFVSDAHPTTGECTVSDDESTLSLNNFKTDDGPKLLLYLSTEVDSNDFVDLGDLKGIEGNFKYNIPDNTDLKKYKYVVVWCVDFSVSFGHAELK